MASKASPARVIGDRHRMLRFNQMVARELILIWARRYWHAALRF